LEIYFFNYASEILEVIVTIPKSMFEIKCTECGENATVPFKPTVGKPVYCKTCFSKHMFKQSESAKASNLNQKQAWARRRDNGQAKKNDVHHSVFHWSYNTPKNEAV